MTRLILFYLIIVSLSACEQNRINFNINLVDKQKRNQDSIEYTQKSVEFIKQVKGQELMNSEFILADKPFAFKYFDCLKELLIDTVIYSKEELTFIEQKKYPSISYWTKIFFPNTKLVSSDTVDLIFEDRSKGWLYFYKKIGHSLIVFLFPFF